MNLLNDTAVSSARRVLMEQAKWSRSLLSQRQDFSVDLAHYQSFRTCSLAALGVQCTTIRFQDPWNISKRSLLHLDQAYIPAPNMPLILGLQISNRHQSLRTTERRTSGTAHDHYNAPFQRHILPTVCYTSVLWAAVT